MAAGVVRKVVDGSGRMDGRAFVFIQPDDGTPDVFAPVRTFTGRQKIAELEGQNVIFEVKEDDRTGKLMAASWKVAGDVDPRDSSRSRSGSSRRSRSRSRRSRSRSRSRRRRSHSKRSRSRSRSRHSPSPFKNRSRTDEVHKVTICDIPPSMTGRELTDLARDMGRSLIVARIYRKGERNCALVEYANKADADKCIAELDYRRVEGSHLRLRCAQGAVHGDLGGDGEPGHDRGKDQRDCDRRHRSGQRPSRGRSRSSPPHRGRSPPRGGTGMGIINDVRPGDWQCRCGVNVFASKDKCFKCGAPKPLALGPPKIKAISNGGDRRGDRADGEELMTVYVPPDLPEDVEEDEIREDFERCCPESSILRVMLVRRENLVSAFVRFSAPKYALRAIEDTKDGDITIRGRPTQAELARRNTAIEN